MRSEDGCNYMTQCMLYLIAVHRSGSAVIIFPSIRKIHNQARSKSRSFTRKWRQAIQVSSKASDDDVLPPENSKVLEINFA